MRTRWSFCFGAIRDSGAHLGFRSGGLVAKGAAFGAAPPPISVWTSRTSSRDALAGLVRAAAALARLISRPRPGRRVLVRQDGCEPEAAASCGASRSISVSHPAWGLREYPGIAVLRARCHGRRVRHRHTRAGEVGRIRGDVDPLDGLPGRFFRAVPRRCSCPVGGRAELAHRPYGTQGLAPEPVSCSRWRPADRSRTGDRRDPPLRPAARSKPVHVLVGTRGRRGRCRGGVWGAVGGGLSRVPHGC